MKIGYARVSTAEQEAGLQAQLAALNAQGCERIFEERRSSVACRPQLDAALDFLRPGDELVVTKLDRLARSVKHLLAIAELVRGKNASLSIGNLGDTSSVSGRLLLQILGAIAEFERAVMLERQRDGIAAAQAAGKYQGRPAYAMRRGQEARALAAEGLGAVAIARRLGISRASVWRILHRPLPAD